MNIYDALRKDHERQRELMAELVSTHGDSDRRNDLFSTLRVELESHAGAEERYFYVPLMKSDLTQEKARHSVAEHKELDDYVEQLEGYDQAGSAWLPTAEELQHRLLHHLEEEEREVFPLSGKALTDRQKDELGAEYELDMERRRADLA